MRKAIPLALAPLVVLALAVPAIGQTFRDRLTMNGVTGDGVTVTAVVVDSDLGDTFSVATQHTVACTKPDGTTSTIVTNTNLLLDQPAVDVQQLLKNVEASGTGTQIVTVFDNCAPSLTVTQVEDVPAALTGLRTSKLENFGNATFRGTGTGTITVGEVTADVAITFTRQPLP